MLPACLCILLTPLWSVFCQAADAEARRGDLTGLEAEVAEVQATLAQHRQRIGLLKQETEASLATSNQLSAAAAAKEAELQAVRVL